MSNPSIVANICEQWGMTLKPEPGDKKWFLDWVLDGPKHVSTHLTAGYHAYSSVLDVYPREEIRRAREFFGGMGAQALMIDRLFDPDYHAVSDYAEQAVAHMKRELPGHIQVEQIDAYTFSPRPEWAGSGFYDVVGLDFGDLTAWKTRDEEPHRLLLDHVFASQPKAVVITDIAARYLHLHRERYEGLLGPGTCMSYETYLDALVARLRALYGYDLVAGFVDRWSTVFTLAPVDALLEPGFFHPTPKTPVGLELL